MSKNGTVLTKHIYGCSALQLVEKGDWSSAWYFDGTTKWRDQNGSTHGETHRFLVLKCNNTDCHAEALLREDFVLAQFEMEVGGTKRVGRQPKGQS